MSQRKADAPLSVEIPPRGADRPAWGKVGVITAIGFIVGVSWPRLAGVRVGPSLPSDAVSPSAAPAQGSAPALALPTGIAAGTPPSSSTPPSTATPPATSPPTLSISHGAVISCRTSDGDVLKGSECGALPGLDGLVAPHLRKLSECPQAAGATGKLHLNVRVDFGRESIGAEGGRGSTVSSPDALVACAKAALADVKPSGLSHDNQRYGVSYMLTFAEEQGAPPAASQPSREAADGTAQVAWEVAVVRDAPKTGKIVARLDRGATVRVGAPKEGWYPIKYGDGFASEGWVYRAAIGR